MHHTCRYLLTHIVQTCLSSRPRGGRLHWRRQVKSAQRAARARQRSAHFRYQGVHFRRGGGQVQLTQQDRLRGGNRVHVSQGTCTFAQSRTCTQYKCLFIRHACTCTTRCRSLASLSMFAASSRNSDVLTTGVAGGDASADSRGHHLQRQTEAAATGLGSR